MSASRTYVPGTPQAVCTARGERLKPFSLWQQKEAITKFFLAKKEERDLMDNDSVIDPLQSPNESRCKNLVPRSTSYPFFHPPVSAEQRASFDFSPLPPGSIEQSPLPLFFSSRRDGGDPPNARFHAFLLSPLICGQFSRSVGPIQGSPRTARFVPRDL